jgi:hypothetical protein
MKINVFVLFLTLLSLVAFTGTLFAQVSLPAYEGFNYAAGNLCVNAGWAPTGVNASNDVLVVDTSLTYTGLPDSTGKKVSVLNGSGFIDPGFDIVNTGNQSEASSVFVSCILNVVNPGLPAGEYFLHVCTAGTTSIDFHSKVFVKQGAGGAGKYLLGIRNASGDAIQYETSDRDINTPVFIVVSYDFVTGAGNDVSRLWINPTLDETTPGTPNLTTIASGTDLAAVGRINLRQPSTNTDMSLEVDEIRAGTTWAFVTPMKGSGVDDWTVF